MEIRYCASLQMFEKHWSIPSCLCSISCSAFKLFQYGICPLHCAANAKERSLTSLWPNSVDSFLSSHVTSLQYLTSFASGTLQKLCSLTYLTTPFILSRLLFFCLPLGLFLFPCCTYTDYCWTTLLMFQLYTVDFYISIYRIINLMVL